MCGSQCHRLIMESVDRDAVRVRNEFGLINQLEN